MDWDIPVHTLLIEMLPGNNPKGDAGLEEIRRFLDSKGMVNGGRGIGTAGYDEGWENPHFPRVGTKQNKVLLEVASGELGSGSTFLGSGEPDYAPPMQEAQAANPEVHAAETASSTASSHESD